MNYSGNKLVRSLAILRKLKGLLGDKWALLANNSLFLPHLNYCAIWSAFLAACTRKLEVLQRKAIKTIFELHPHTPSAELHGNFRILKPLEMRAVQKCIYMHKLVNGALPFAITPSYLQYQI